jgi:hypothetical protein
VFIAVPEKSNRKVSMRKHTLEENIVRKQPDLVHPAG